jgi:hypothetical protein
MKSLYNFLEKRGQSVFFGLGLLLVIIYFASVSAGLNDFNKLATKPVDERITSNLFNFGINVGVALVIICAVITVILGLIYVAQNFKKSLRLLIAVGVLLVMFFILKSTSSGVDTLPEEMVADFDLNDAKATMVGGALKTAVVLMGLTILAFVGAEVRNLFK